jgi:ATP-binding cassette, subfamily B, bacterial
MLQVNGRKSTSADAATWGKQTSRGGSRIWSAPELRLLVRYVGPHWRALVTVLAAMAIRVALSLLRPWPTKLLVDNVLGQLPLPVEVEQALTFLPGSSGIQGLLLWVCLSTIVLYFATVLLSSINSLASLRLGQAITYDLGADLFRHMQQLSLLFHNRRQVGDSIARVAADPKCLQDLTVRAVLPLGQALATLVAMLVIMWQLEWTMTLVVLLVAPSMFVGMGVFGRRIRRRQRENADLEGGMMSTVQRTLSALPAVQAFTREDQEHAQFRRYADRALTAVTRTAYVAMGLQFSSSMPMALGTAAIMWLGASYALEGRVTVGTVLVFLSYLQFLYDPLERMTESLMIWQRAAANADRVIEILATAPEVQDRPNARDVALQGHVQYEGVAFGYEPGEPVLKGISFEAARGQTVAIVGPSGAGKTTLVNLLVRFFEPWSGSIRIDGHDLRDLRLRCLRQQVAIVLQESFIFPLTAAQNIAYGRPDASREEIVAAAVAARAHDYICRLPNGYDTVIGERGVTLSGGEQQRLSIARAFLKDAPLLIMDEPTSSLDAETESLLLDSMERLMRQRTTLLIAHRFSTIRNAHQILVLDKGEIVERGGHTELLAQNGLYASQYRQQAEPPRPVPQPTEGHPSPLGVS